MSKNDSEETPPRIKRKTCEKELRKLHTELCRLHDWVVHKGVRVIVLFEGRDAAGKGGTINAIMERVSQRVFHLVALPAPSDPEKRFPMRNAICSTFRRRAKLSSSIAAGTTAPASNM